MVTLSVLLLPALLCMPATDPRTMLLVDLPLVIGTTGSLSAFYMLAESAQGRSRLSALARLPMLIALGAGLAPHLTKAVFEGLSQMSGEFVRTPKKGSKEGRYRARATLPMTEIVLALISFAAVIASIQTRHWFATPFAMLFTFGYGYIALLVASEQATRRREAVTNELPNNETMSEPPAALVEDMVEDAAALRCGLVLVVKRTSHPDPREKADSSAKHEALFPRDRAPFACMMRGPSRGGSSRGRGARDDDEGRNYWGGARTDWWLREKRGGRSRGSRVRDHEGDPRSRREDQDFRFRKLRSA
jgi:hypothetical protein